MASDAEGNLKPLMLSDLVRTAQEVLAMYGDMPVGVETCVAGSEYNVTHSLPVSDEPAVSSPRWLKSYWPGRFARAFIVDGA